MKNKRSLFAVGLLLLVLAVGVTFAVFSTTSLYNNLFSLGNYNVVTHEIFTSPKDWSPGDTTTKILYAENNGEKTAVVRVKYTEFWKRNGSTLSNVPNDAVTINFTTPSTWTYNPDDGYYYYNFYLEPTQKSSSLIESVTLNPNLNDDVCSDVEGVYTCRSNLNNLNGATYTLKFTIETVDADKYEEVWDTQFDFGIKSTFNVLNGKSKRNLVLGDEICLDGALEGQCFNFVRYDGNNIVMLSKYNLKVGNIYDIDGETKTGEYTSADDGYGLQSSEVKGGITGDRSEIRYGTVAFSETNYWDDGSNLKSEYGSSYPADVYDTDYSDASGNNYSIAYYVENYKNILETYGLTVQSARLLSISEANTNLGCTGDGATNGTCPDGFIKNTSFWLSVARNNGKVLAISRNGTLYARNYYGDGVTGVRPVVVVSLSEVYDETEEPIVTLPKDKLKENLSIGDEICINGDSGKQCFHFIKYDGNDVVLFAKYNLNVGYKSIKKEDFLQNKKCGTSGGYSDCNVGFSGDKYWYVEHYNEDDDSYSYEYLPQYGETWETSNLYDSNYVTKPNLSYYNCDGYNVGKCYDTRGYSVAYYVEKYKEILEEKFGVDISSARLMTYSDILSFNCLNDNNECNLPFFNTSFWLASYNSSGTNLMCFKGEVETPYYGSGVRPLIYIPKSYLN